MLARTLKVQLEGKGAWARGGGKQSYGEDETYRAILLAVCKGAYVDSRAGLPTKRAPPARAGFEQDFLPDDDEDSASCMAAGSQPRATADMGIPTIPDAVSSMAPPIVPVVHDLVSNDGSCNA